MRHSLVFATLTLFIFSIAIFSIWFFPLQGYTLAGLLLGTIAIITGIISAVATGLTYGEGN